jgi:hypothetical protein
MIGVLNASDHHLTDTIVPHMLLIGSRPFTLIGSGKLQSRTNIPKGSWNGGGASGFFTGKNLHDTRPLSPSGAST